MVKNRYSKRVFIVIVACTILPLIVLVLLQANRNFIPRVEEKIDDFPASILISGYTSESGSSFSQTRKIKIDIYKGGITRESLTFYEDSETLHWAFEAKLNPSRNDCGASSLHKSAPSIIANWQKTLESTDKVQTPRLYPNSSLTGYEYLGKDKPSCRCRITYGDSQRWIEDWVDYEHAFLCEEFCDLRKCVLSPKVFDHSESLLGEILELISGQELAIRSGDWLKPSHDSP